MQVEDFDDMIGKQGYENRNVARDLINVLSVIGSTVRKSCDSFGPCSLPAKILVEDVTPTSIVCEWLVLSYWLFAQIFLR